MNRSSKSPKISRRRTVMVASLALLALASAQLAEAQSYCQEWTDTLLPVNTNCVTDPRRDRAFGGETFSFKGDDYYIFSRGNELGLYRLGNVPSSPEYLEVSKFRFGTAGDSDYDVVGFDTCDDCRYMVMDHKVAGVVVIDLGTGIVPSFTGYSRQGARSFGSVTFSHGGAQYLVAAGVGYECNSRTALHLVNNANDLQFIECVEADGSQVLMGGGQPLRAGGETYLYLGEDKFGDAHVYRVDGSGSAVTLTETASPALMKARSSELALDANHLIGASADFMGGRVLMWDLSSPGNPVQRTSWTIGGLNVSMVDLASQSASTPLVLWAAGIGYPNSTHTYLIDESGPEPFDNAFWSDLSEPHNDFQECVPDAGGALSPDGSTLYLSRFSTQQTFDLSECLGPTAATAIVQVTPSTGFPGDTLVVADKTAGSYDRWAVWVERNGGFFDGNQTPSGTNPHSFEFTIPQNMAFADTFEAKISIQSDDIDPLVSTDAQSITVDRTPTADFTITPAAAVVGDTVILAATAEGNPSSTDPFTWVIQKPSSATSFPVGPSIPVTLDQPGEWEFTLTVNYDHEASGGGTYAAVVVKTLDVSSVAADFRVSPTPPLSNLPVTFDGSISKGNVSNYAWQIYGPTDRGGEGIEPADYTGCPTAVSCTVQGDVLEWGRYEVTLTVSNTTGDENAIMQVVDLLNGAIQPTIRWTPNNPEIGENTIFSIDNVFLDVDKVTWNMGGTGCDNESATQVCTPTLFQDCKAFAFQYSSAGAKVVSVSVEIAGVTYTDTRAATERTVTVANSGSCDGGGGPTCTYSISPSSAVFGPGGGSSSFTVFTGSGCSWTANESASWLTITSGTSRTGTGTVNYNVAANDGPRRVALISAGGQGHTVTQNPPSVPVDFTMSKVNPEIGETITFTADPVLEIDHWDFGEASCDGQSSVKNCFWLPEGACNEVTWNFGSSGQKSVTMVLTDGSTKVKHPTVQNRGECCLADGAPRAFFEGPSEAGAGQRVTFTDTSFKNAAVKAIGANWTPTVPDIGEQVTFSLSGLTGTISKATWQFGETGCGGESATKECVASLFNDCKGMTFTYAASGAKSVSVAIDYQGGGTANAGPFNLTVANAGTCDGGDGGGGCSYTLTPLTADFPIEGGTGVFSVATDATCDWTATTTSGWIDITAGSGTGPGTVNYTVAESQLTTNRLGYIKVEGRTHTVRQDAVPVEEDRAPTAWSWTAARLLDGGGLGEVVGTGSDPIFNITFAEAGTYRVTLVSSNCAGSAQYAQDILIVDSPVEDFVVGAAVSLAGANETQWESDFRFFNPCGEPLDVRIEYEPEGENNTDATLVFREFELNADETRVFASIVDAIPGLAGDELSGSVRIESSSDSGCKVVSVSRTFNDTPDGSLGLFVPALPVKSNGVDYLDLTGLIQNTDYRTNLRLVNYGDDDVWVPLQLYERDGSPFGSVRSTQVRGHSTKQINDIASWLGVEGGLVSFSVRAGVTGIDVEAYATVVDNQTGDSVLFMSNFSGENRVWLVGVASLEGVNQSQWRTDVWLYNPTETLLPGEVEFVVGDSPGDAYGFEFPTLGTHRVKQYLDIVGEEFGLDETRGYIVVTGADNGPAPQVAARTYNLDLAGGTYGLNLRAFNESELLYPGDTAYIAGISNSADLNTGFRTNLGLLNTDRDNWTGVLLTLFDVTGTQIGDPQVMNIAPGVLRQFDIAKKFGVGDVTGVASLEIEVTSGGGVAAYATEIDNRTQDSIYIPAQPMIMGAVK